MPIFKRSNNLKDVIRCSFVTKKSKNLLKAIQLACETLEKYNVSELKIKNGYKQGTYDYMDLKITGRIEVNGAVTRFEIQFILKTLLQYKTYSHRAYEIGRNIEYYVAADTKSNFIYKYDLQNIIKDDETQSFCQHMHSSGQYYAFKSSTQ